MIIKNVPFENTEIHVTLLDEALESLGFERPSNWDYERVSYDFKYEILDEVFYLRVQGYAIKGDVGNNSAVIRLLQPILGKHYYPHGVEYGEDEVFPTEVLQHSENLIAEAHKRIAEKLTFSNLVE
ncbi:MAG: YugN family protein [Bacilli bacterium]